MTTYQIGYPSDVRHRLERVLPQQQGAWLGVRVTPRDRAGRRCPAYEADHYEVQTYYTTTDAGSLDRLEKALRGLPGVYLTTQVRGCGSGRNEAVNPAWPAALGASRRGFHSLRPSVLALIRD